MDRNNYPGGFNRVFRSPRGLKEKPWQHDDLNVLQLDFVDRHVVKIAGNHVHYKLVSTTNRVTLNFQAVGVCPGVCLKIN